MHVSYGSTMDIPENIWDKFRLIKSFTAIVSLMEKQVIDMHWQNV